MHSKAVRIAQHRRAVWAGLTISASAHVVALTVVAIPGTGPTEDDGRDAKTVYEDTFEGIEVVALAEVVPVDPTSIRPTETDAASGAQPTPSVEATSRPSLTERLADLAPASVSVSAPQTGRPIATFRDLEAVSQEAFLAGLVRGGGIQDGDEEEGGGWSAFLGGLSAALSGGGHCPVPAGGSQ